MRQRQANKKGMPKLQPTERLELKGAIIRIAHVLFDIDTRMEPSLSERINVLREKEYTDDQLREIYDKYMDELAEEYCNRIEE